MVCFSSLSLGTVAAQAQSLGGHFGVNLDTGNLHLGVDGYVPLSALSPRVRISIWPSFAHVFVDDGHDVELLGCDVPFEFQLERSVVTPFVAPGIGLAFYGDTTLKV